MYVYIYMFGREEIDISMVIGLVMGEDSEVIEYD